MMRYVDQILRDRGLFPAQRAMHAWLEISSSLGLNLRMTPIQPARPPRSFVGDDLTARIFDWYDSTYGERMKMLHGPVPSIIRIRDEPWKVRFPRIFGTVQFCIDNTTPRTTPGTQVGKNKPPMCNVLDSVVDLPDGLRSSLQCDELRQVFNDYIDRFTHSSFVDGVYQQPLVSDAQSDLIASVDHILSVRPHFGNSQWSSLQAAEKMMKAMLRVLGSDPPNTHNLSKLNAMLANHAIPQAPLELLDSIQCSPGVRYGEVQVAQDEAVDAHIAALQVCGCAAQVMAERITPTNPPPQVARGRTSPSRS